MKIGFVVVFVLAAGVRLAAQTYTFDPPGSFYGTYPYSINTGGTITGTYEDNGEAYHGFVRDPQGNITSFDPPGGGGTKAYSINTSGAITGYYADANSVIHGFLRDPQGNFTSFDPPGSIETIPYSINTSGAITGYYLNTTVQAAHGFVRDPQGNFTSFDPTGSTRTLPISINTSGAITGTYDEPYGGPHGFVRDPQGNIFRFDPPGSIGTSSNSINTSGAITGWYQDAVGFHGFVRDPQGNITSFDPASPSSINASGAIAGCNGPGFVRDPQGNITSFEVPGSIQALPVSINTSGAVTGYYLDGNYVNHGFTARAPNGMDISKYTRPTTVSFSSWASAVSAGVTSVVVQAWGGVSKNQLANSQLSGAQSYGLNTGAYVLLTYFSNRSAEHQVAEAAQAVGSAITGLTLMAVEVATCCGEFVSWKASTNYVAGAQIMDPANHIQKVTGAGTSGAQAPMWNDTGGTSTDGTVTWQDTGNVVISQAQRTAYISNAVAYINKQYPSLKVAIFTSNEDWQAITGNCGTSGSNACPPLIALPLWDVEHREFTGGDGNKHLGDGVAGLVPWKPWGPTTWQTRDGNQYDWGLCTSAALPLEENPDAEARAAVTCGNESFFGLTAVNLDYLNPTLFK